MLYKRNNFGNNLIRVHENNNNNIQERTQILIRLKIM